MRRLMAALLAVLFGTGFAHADSPPSPSELAQQFFNERLAALGQQVAACTQARAELPYERIKALDLPKETLKTALLYYFVLADYECTRKETGEFLVAAAALKSLSEPAAGIDEGVVAGTEMAVDTLVRLLKQRSAYLKLDSETRSSLEGVEELKKPFDPIKAGEKLGL